MGQAVNTVLVMALTFGGTVPASKLLRIITAGSGLKVAYEVLATPLIYLVVNFVKRAEHSDALDAHTNFNPFAGFLSS